MNERWRLARSVLVSGYSNLTNRHEDAHDPFVSIRAIRGKKHKWTTVIGEAFAADECLII